MTTYSDATRTSIRQLETCLFTDEFFKESDSHPLLTLRNELQQIDGQSRSITIDEQQKVMSDLHYFEINCFSQLLQRYSSLIPSSITKALLETIRYQMNIGMNVNPSLADHYFDVSVTYLTASPTINYLKDKTEMPTDLDELLLQLFASVGSRAVQIKTNMSYSICVSYQNIPKFFQLTPSTESLLRALIIYLNNRFLHKYQKHQSHSFILKWLLSLTNIHGFVPYFVKSEYPQAVLQWLTIKREQAEHISINSWYLILNLLHNLARHRTGVKTLNKLKAIAVLKQWKDQYIAELVSLQNDENNKDILIAYHLVYANLLEPKELKKEEISSIQTGLDYILERTIQAFNSPDLSFASYSICEYLKGLAKFVVNDKFLLYIISRPQIFDLFLEKFLLFNAAFPSTDLNGVICSSLYTIFWSISFQTDYHCRLKSIEQFVQHVERTSKMESDDELAVVIKRAAKGILFNLDLISIDVQPIEENISEKKPSRTKVMVSYAHKDATFCRKIVESLRELFQGDVWVDFEKLSMPYEDNWEEIAIAITQCDVILMIVTENYCSSKSCRREVIHADKRNKRMIPIYQGKDYKPEDWFEIRVGSAVWVRFGDKRSDEEVTKILLGLINVQDKVKPNQAEISASHEVPTQAVTITEREVVPTLLSLPSVPLAPPSEIHVQTQPILPNMTPTSAVEQWTAEEVQQWLRLPSSGLQLSSGRALLAYGNLLAHEDAQYDEYEHRMRAQGVSREQFANLVASLSSIRSAKQTSNTKFPEQWASGAVKDWFQQHHLSDSLFDVLGFSDGSEVLTYAQLMVDVPTAARDEYDRLRRRIGKDAFHLDEYARFLCALKKLASSSRTGKDTSSCALLYQSN